LAKLSETVRGVAAYLDPIALAWARVTKAALHGIAGTLEAGPLTLPGLRVPFPAVPAPTVPSTPVVPVVPGS
jgi:hypothetical protein